MHLNEYTKSTSVNILWVLAVSLMQPVLSPLIKSLGFSNFKLGLIFSGMALMLVISSPIIGRLSDSIGRNRIIKFGIIAELFAILAYNFGTGWVILTLGRILEGFAFGTVGIGIISKIGDSTEEKTRGKQAGMSLSLATIGRIIGPLIGGFIADLLFAKSPLLLSSFLLGILMIMLPKENKIPQVVKKSSTSPIKNFLNIKQLKGMGIIGFAMNSMSPILVIFLPLLIIERLGLSYRYVGIAYFVLYITHSLQFLFGEWYNEKLHIGVFFGSMIAGISTFLIFFVSNYYLLLLLLFLKGIGNSIWNVTAWTLMSNIGEKKGIQGEVIGSYISIAQFGAFIAFIYSGYVVDKLGVESLFLVLGWQIIVCSFISYKYISPDKTFVSNQTLSSTLTPVPIPAED